MEEEQSTQETVQPLRPQSQQSSTTVIPKEQLNESAGGMPLVSRSRKFMEARFGADFSRVQMHADQHAAAVCDSISVRAFTYRSHIYFGTREYQPETEAGRRVLAHELTQLVQQGGGQPATPRIAITRGSQLLTHHRQSSGWAPSGKNCAAMSLPGGAVLPG